MPMNFHDFQPSPDQLEWEMPGWGHQIAQGVMPLFLGKGGKLFPIGTVFVFGRIQFMLTVAHNIEEMLKHDPRFANLNPRHDLGGQNHIVNGLSLYALHHKKIGHQHFKATLLPLKKITVATPTDVVTATADFVKGLQTFSSPISFRLPSVGESVFSVGYADFKYPDAGIDLNEARNHEFDWQNSYSHRLIVREGRVRDLFTLCFARGYMEGPCFTFEGEILHGMSGGPIYNSSGNICGLNSASASSFFNEPMTIGSLLYPLLSQTISFGAVFGSVDLNATHLIRDLVYHGTITTDGSEAEIAFTENLLSGGIIAHPSGARTDVEHTHDDFNAFQAGTGASHLTGKYIVVKKTDPNSSS